MNRHVGVRTGVMRGHETMYTRSDRTPDPAFSETECSERVIIFEGWLRRDTVAQVQRGG